MIGYAGLTLLVLLGLTGVLIELTGPQNPVVVAQSSNTENVEPSPPSSHPAQPQATPPAPAAKLPVEPKADRPNPEESSIDKDAGKTPAPEPSKEPAPANEAPKGPMADAKMPDVPEPLKIDDTLYLRVLFSGNHRFGIGLTSPENRPAPPVNPKGPAPEKRERGKLLTYSDVGDTNNTCLLINNRAVLFGQGLGKAGAEHKESQAPIAYQDGPSPGWKSYWEYPTVGLRITQDVSIRRGQQSRRLDTCLVRYTIENKGKITQQAGLRFMLDTFIGGNDGVPFAIPGKNGLCTTFAVFRRSAEVPPYIQALEFPNLRNPGTIAHLTLKVPDPSKKLEPPSAVQLSAWLDSESLWQIPLVSISKANDSAVFIYWDAKSINPGTSRQMAFAYGLGTVTNNEADGKLALTIGGDLFSGGEFYLTAYVAKPTPGMTATIRLPEGLKLAEGEARQNVPSVMGQTFSQVAWKIKTEKPGRFKITVELSDGTTQTHVVNVLPNILP